MLFIYANALDTICQGSVLTESTRPEGVIFGAHLRELRLARGLTQAQLADRARSNVIFISKLERGTTTPALGMLIRLADALDCHITDLVKVFNRGPRISPKSRKD